MFKALLQFCGKEVFWKTFRGLTLPKAKKCQTKEKWVRLKLKSEEGYVTLRQLAIFPTYQPSRSRKYHIQGLAVFEQVWLARTIDRKLKLFKKQLPMAEQGNYMSRMFPIISGQPWFNSHDIKYIGIFTFLALVSA